MIINQTLKKFGYPSSLIKEYENWCLLLRGEQITLGAVILVSKEGATRFSDLSLNSLMEYPQIIVEVERKLKKIFDYDKINILMLMMRDPYVHFHIIPRYEECRVFEEQKFFDFGWPYLPNFSKNNNITGNNWQELKDSLARTFSK